MHVNACPSVDTVCLVHISKGSAKLALLSLSLSFSLLLPLPLLTKNRQIEVYIQRRTFVSAPKWAWRRKMPFKTGKKLQWRERETSSLTELIRSGQLFGNYFTSQQ